MSEGQADVVVAEARFLRLVRRGSWEFVQRTSAHGVVIIVPLTDTRRVLLVEQYRPPVRNRVIEFPAGLVGDEQSDETLDDAARRELLEETGYYAGRLQCAFAGPSSAGLADETATFYLATQLEKAGPGGGTGGEDLTVHQVPLSDVDRWLDEKSASGLFVGARVLAGLYLLRRAFG